MLLLPISAQYLSADTGFIICIILLLFFGVLSGTVQSTAFGLGGVLPFKYMGAIMFGNGISGITTNVL
jgi:hypothetical protein